MSTNSATAAPAAQRTAAGRDWRDVYAARLVVTDLLVLIWVVFGVQIGWLGLNREAANFGREPGEIVISYTAISVTVIAGWMAVLKYYDTRSDRVVGAGSGEYKLIADASIRLFGLAAIVAFILKVDLARGYILIAFPFGIAVLILSRWMWRQWLGVQRRNGLFTSRVVLVGSDVTASHIARELMRNPESGYLVVGACLPKGDVGAFLQESGIAIYESVSSVAQAMIDTDADTVAITSVEELTPQGVRELSWSLEPRRQHLIVAPSLTDIGGPRIHTRPVAGLPLIHVETPRYDGVKHLSKRIMDVVGSTLLLVLSSIPLLLLAVLVRASGPGPVIYKQTRVGLNGVPFNMLKFRSMRADADAELAQLLREQGTAERPLFKVHNDPRITRIGRVLRKYSLDELPQLLNVLKGDMSLVGPRPQRDGEVALYDSAAHRRLLLKPGMSGLWQVSGRSSLSWEDSIRLDLFYVENWSITGDVVILWRTMRAVIAPGAEAH